jgi:hypothetical protein
LKGKMLGNTNIIFKNPSQSDICLFDRSGEELLRQIILGNKQISVINLFGRVVDGHRKVYLSLSVIYHMVHLILQGDFPANFGFKKKILTAYYYSLVVLIRPKVMISLKGQYGFFLGVISNNLPSLKIIAMPWADSRHFYMRNMIPSNIEYYLCGTREKTIYDEYNHPEKNNHYLGSLLGGFLVDEYKNTKQKHYDLCIISQVVNIFFEVTQTQRMKEAIGSQKILANYLDRFNREMSLKVCIAFRPQAPTEKLYEHDFFEKNMSCPKTYIDNDQSNFSTYRAMMQSDIVITSNFSAAAIDAFGWGQKVLFCDFYENLDYWSEGLEWTVIGQEYETFKGMLTRLIDCDHKQYMAKIEATRQRYNNIDPRNPLHRVIKDNINSYLMEN